MRTDDDVQATPTGDAPAPTPLAVVGRAVRFPGADDVAAYWALLREGRTTVRRIPEGRWNLDALAAYAGRDIPEHVLTGGWLDDVMGFDAGLFRMSPREARTLDPKQRMAMTVAFEALEDAGLAPARRPSLHVGVYVAISRSEYLQRFYHRGEFGREDGDRYFGTGTDSAFAAGRIGAALGCDGPAINLDTACSSSLVSLHLAMRDLRAGDCDVAIAGGTHLLDRPEMSVVMDRFGILSPDARCAAFEASARGYVRGEGVGFAVLRRLDDALADGDRILAVVRGSAVNSNGRSDNLMAPDEDAQVRLLRAALRDAGLRGADIDYAEAHGTGTSVGDPIEARALVRALADGRDGPLPVGTAKANIGHLELSAGIAGFLKAVEVVRHGIVPPHLHLSARNPAVPGPDQLALATEPTPLVAPGGRPRRAVVNSFGISGTNACVVLEQPPPPAASAPAGPVVAWLSAPTPERLRDTAVTWIDAVERGADALALARRGLTGQGDHVARAGAVLHDRAEAQDWLHAVADGSPTPGHRGDGGRPPRILLAFTGQGSQRAGMGLDLDLQVPAFSRGLDEVDAVLRPLLGHPIRDVLRGDTVDLDDTRWTQPALFALGWAQWRAWQALGVRPHAVMGHSIGELTAATVAGVFSLSDAAQLVDARARGMGALPPGGGMAAVLTDAQTVLARLETHPSLALAADNGGRATVVSGAQDDLDRFVAALDADGIATRPLTVSHAFHSPRMDPMLAGFEAVVAGLTPRPAVLDVYSNVTGQAERAALADPTYWTRHLRGTVRFAPGVLAAADAGCDVLLELGPDATLCGMARRVLRGRDVALIPTLPRGGGDGTLRDPATALWTRGAPITPAALLSAPAPWAPVPPTPQVLRHLEVEDPGPTAAAPATLREAGPALWRLRFDPVEVVPAPLPDGTWLVVGGDGATDAAARLRDAAADVVEVGASPEALADAVALHAPLAGVVVAGTLAAHAIAPGDPAFDEAVRTHAFAPVAALQALDAAGSDAPLIVWTREGLAPSPSAPARPLAAAVHGAARTIAVEHRDRHLIRHDLGPDDAVPPVAQWLVSDEDTLVWRAGQIQAPRLVPAGAAPDAPPVRGTWLISGGTGGLGLATAAWLEAQGAARVVLLSRSQPTGEAAAWLADAPEHRLHRAVDLADAGAVRAVVDGLTGGPPLRGVLHAAGVLADAPVRFATPDGFASVFAAKTGGLHALMAALDGAALDHLVVYSSVTATLGAPGQVNYGAANAAMEAMAATLRAQGVPATALGWGPWAEVGMAAALADRMTARGMQPLRPAQALALLGSALAAPAELLLPLHVRADQLAAADPARLEAPLLRAWTPGPRPSAAVEPTPAASVPAPPAAPSDAPRTPAPDDVLQGVVEEAATLLGFAPDELDAQRPLAWQGLDSVLAVDLREAILARFGVDLPLDAIVTGPRPRELAALVAQACPVSPSPAPTPTPAQPPAAPSAPGAGPVPEALHHLVAELLGFEPQDLDPTRPLAWQGFDSVLAVDLHGVLAQRWGVDVPMDLLATGPRLTEIAGYLPDTPIVAPTAPAPSAPAPPAPSPIAEDPADATPPPVILWVLLVVLLGAIAAFAIG